MRSFVTSPEATITASPEAAAPIPSAPTQALARHAPSAYVDGDISSSDLKMPYLSCVQAVGPKSVLFTPGTLVLGETAITKPPAPSNPTPRLRVLFCKVSKIFIENLPYNPTAIGQRPRIFRTKAEVDALGGVTEWRGNVPPTFIPKLTSLVLVRQPSDSNDDAAFNLIDDTKTYAPAMVSFQKTSYSAAKTLLTDLSLSLKNDPTATLYDLFWARELKGANWVWVAKLVRVRDEKPTDSLKQIANKMAGTNVEVETDDE